MASRLGNVGRICRKQLSAGFFWPQSSKACCRNSRVSDSLTVPTIWNRYINRPGLFFGIEGVHICAIIPMLG